jgi:hypothetical protein
MQSVRRLERWPVQPPRACQIDVGFIDRGHLDLRRKLRQNMKDFFRILAVSRRLPVHEDRLRA